MKQRLMVLGVVLGLVALVTPALLADVPAYKSWIASLVGAIKVVYTNDRVGIGTAAPTEPLEVVGNAKVSANLTVDSPTLVVDAATDRVGIGTTTPASSLEVVGTVTSTGLTVASGSVSLPPGQIDPAEVSFNYAGSLSQGGPASDVACTNCVTLGPETSGSYDATPDTIADDGVIDDTEASDVLSINNGLLFAPTTGNLGIGTTTPATKLDVVGDVQWTGTLQGGSVPWVRLATFPSACPAGEFVTAVGGTLTCAPGGGVGGSGTPNLIPKFTAATTLADSVISEVNGNVGIGTTSPQRSLHITAPTVEQIFEASGASADNKNWRLIARSAGLLQIQTLSDAFGVEQTAIEIQRSGNSIVDVSFPSGNVGIGMGASIFKLEIKGQLYVQTDVGVLGTRGVIVDSDGTNARVVAYSTRNASRPPLVFLVNEAEQMRIATNGYVGIGTTGPLDKLQVAGDIRVGTGTTGCVKDADGSIIAGTCSSDIALKKNIKPLNSVLDKVTQLEPVQFTWRSDEFPQFAFGNETQLGLIAQQVEQYMPELVTEKDGFKAVHYEKLPLLLLQVVKEQQERINTQQRELNQLKALVCADHPEVELCK